MAEGALRKSAPLMKSEPLCQKTFTLTQDHVLYIAVLLIFLGRAGFLLTNSLLEGRLSFPPPYDDITYFVDALRRLRLFNEEGTAALLHDLYTTPVHAPLSLLLGFLGFGLFGAREFAPYLLNAVVISICVASLIKLSRIEFSHGILIAAIVSFLPFNDWAITFFHPDLLAGLIAATFCTALLAGKLSSYQSKTALLMGLFAGIGILSKPTAFPVVLALYGTTASTILVSYYLELKRQKSAFLINRKALFNTVLLIASAICVIAPYFLVNGKRLLAYIHMALVDHQVVAGVEGSFWHQATYYAININYFMGVSLFVLALCLVFLFAVNLSRKEDTVRIIASLIVIGIVAYMITSLPKVKLTIFGCYIYGIAIALLIVSLSGVVRWLELRSLKIANVLLASTFLYVIYNYKDIQYRPDKRLVEAENSYYSEVSTILLPRFVDSSVPAKPVPLVFLLYPWPVPPRAFMFNLLRGGAKLDEIANLNWATADIIKPDFDTYVRTFNRANLIIIPSDGAITEMAEHYPVNGLVPELNRYLRERTEFQLIHTVETSYGQIFVYQHGG